MILVIGILESLYNR